MQYFLLQNSALTHLLLKQKKKLPLFPLLFGNTFALTAIESFDVLQSEKILQIEMLYKRGEDVFGSSENFLIWLQSENIALGKTKPQDLLGSVFGISLLMDELTRIEHGVLA